VFEVALVSVGAFFMRGTRGRVVNSGIGLVLVDDDGVPICKAEDMGVVAITVVFAAWMRDTLACIDDGGRGGPASDILFVPSIGES
jgi:hypothetical protein